MSKISEKSSSGVTSAPIQQPRGVIAQSQDQPLECLDKCRGEKIRVLFRNTSEFVGRLVGYDELINLVMEDVIEYTRTEDGFVETHHYDEMLQNGIRITLIAQIDTEENENGKNSQIVLETPQDVVSQ